MGFGKGKPSPRNQAPAELAAGCEYPARPCQNDVSGITEFDDGELDTVVNEKAPYFFNSGENYISHFEPRTEFTVGVESGDPLVSIVREKLFTVRWDSSVPGTSRPAVHRKTEKIPQER
jgi:hypothetical protein